MFIILMNQSITLLLVLIPNKVILSKSKRNKEISDLNTIKSDLIE